MEFIVNANPLLLQEAQIERWREHGVTLGLSTNFRERSDDLATQFVARLRLYFADVQRVMQLLDVPPELWGPSAGHAERILDFLVQKAGSTDAFYVCICYYEKKVFTKLLVVPCELPDNFVLVDPKPVIAER